MPDKTAPDAPAPPPSPSPPTERTGGRRFGSEPGQPPPPSPSPYAPNREALAPPGEGPAAGPTPKADAYLRGAEQGAGQASPRRRRYDHDTPVIYVDHEGVRHTALVTQWHPVAPGDDGEGAVDLVFVDGSGQFVAKPVERRPNVPHISRTGPAPSRDASAEFWVWSVEAP